MILEIEVPGMHIIVRSAEITTVSCAMSASRPWRRFWISENGEEPPGVDSVGKVDGAPLMGWLRPG
jgi:hypothetical protein